MHYKRKIGNRRYRDRPKVGLKYLRHKHDNTFFFPQVNDYSRQDEDDIICILKPPEEKRGLLTFNINIQKYNFQL
jgi:hypothetical protein